MKNTQPGAGRAFLDELGNPFCRIVTDTDGAAGIELGRLWRAGDLCGGWQGHHPVQTGGGA